MEEVRGENKGDNGGVDMLWLVVLKYDRAMVMNGQQKKTQPGQGKHFGPLPGRNHRPPGPRKVANVLTGEHLMNNAAMASVRLALICSALLFI